MNYTSRLRPLFADIGFISLSALLLLFVQAILRAVLWARNPDLASGTPTTDLLWAFVVGLRFDLIISSYILLPLVLALLLPNGLGQRKLAKAWLIVTAAIVLFLGISEPEFYHEFHTRLNSLAIQYLKEDPATVSSMIWHGFPVVRYLLLWAVLVALFTWILVKADQLTRKFGRHYPAWWLRLPVFLICAFLIAWGARGTLRSGAPLRWGDAFHSQSLFANHLALNGTWSLARAAMGNKKKDAGKSWLKIMPAAQALERTRKLLLTPDDTLVLPAQYPVLRRHTPRPRLPVQPRNLVFIIMESFSGQFTGALDNDHGITPRFDELAKDGLIFDRFFSNGTHTHQGMFSTVACFPNLPGFEYLMQEPEGQHQFSGLPALLKPMGFEDVYVYNGAFNWDNQKGFFRNQGMTRFIGRDHMENPVFTDPTWGVSDQDMFDQALRELNRMHAEKPFFAVLQTLSNHTPYALPDPLPVSPVTGFGGLNAHLTAQRYADWALGRFFDEARKQPWYKDTLFMLVGDHGFGVKNQLSEIDLLRFHVPMLLLAPGIQDVYGKRVHTAATQQDIVPTAVSLLLGKPFTHQCWGRDLLSLPADDPGFGIIKPSSSDHTVAHFRGDRIVIKPPHGKAIAGRYQLYPTPSFTPDKEMPEKADMLADLKAYVSTAMHALLENRTGLPPAADAENP
ncbi:LTA synthase family protein [Thiolapillus sp.]|uniref:LTA synthase family protein n=2 Tax=Thiolapillus sp. TaxID=2017437 RepID=UPI003AF4BB54